MVWVWHREWKWKKRVGKNWWGKIGNFRSNKREAGQRKKRKTFKSLNECLLTED